MNELLNAVHYAGKPIYELTNLFIDLSGTDGWTFLEFQADEGTSKVYILTNENYGASIQYTVELDGAGIITSIALSAQGFAEA